MVHLSAGRAPRNKTGLHTDQKDANRSILVQLVVIATLLCLGGGVVGYLLNDGHFHASLFIGAGALMICLSLGVGVLATVTSHKEPDWDSVSRSRSDMVFGLGLFVTVAAIMSPFLHSALTIGFRNISAGEQYAIVAVGLGLLAALGSLFWDRR